MAKIEWVDKEIKAGLLAGTQAAAEVRLCENDWGLLTDAEETLLTLAAVSNRRTFLLLVDGEGDLWIKESKSKKSKQI